MTNITTLLCITSNFKSILGTTHYIYLISLHFYMNSCSTTHIRIANKGFHLKKKVRVKQTASNNVDQWVQSVALIPWKFNQKLLMKRIWNNSNQNQLLQKLHASLSHFLFILPAYFLIYYISNLHLLLVDIVLCSLILWVIQMPPHFYSLVS